MNTDFEYYLEQVKVNEILSEELTPDQKTIQNLNVIKNKINSMKSLTKMKAMDLDNKMNAYWKQISASKIINQEAKRIAGTLIQSIQALVKSKSANV